MGKRTRNLVFVLYVVVFTFLAGEIVVRVLYGRFSNYNMEMWRYASELKQPLPYENLPFCHHPNRQSHCYGVDLATNSLGLRDDEYSVAKATGKKRIVVIGDSFTLGWGVEFDQTVCKRLEYMLGRDEYEVINMGVGNYNSIMEVELFKQKGLQFNPDLVILMFFLNDTEGVPRGRTRLANAFIGNSYFYAFLFGRYVRLKSRFVEDADWKSYYRNLYSRENQENIEAASAAIKDLISLCRRNDIKLLVANIPELRNLEDYEFGLATDYISGLAEEGGVPFVDLLPSLAVHTPESLWVSREDPHANGKANEIIAQRLNEEIREEMILQ